jgi:hypothetical protein
MPELLKMGLEAQQGMVGAPAPFFGIVAYLGKLGLALDREDYGIQIEDQRGSGCGQREQLGAKLVVKSHQLTNCPGREPFEKPSQRGLIGKSGESQQGEKDPVVLQDLGLVDPSQSGHDGIEQSQDQIGGEILGAAWRDPDILLNPPAESELVAKSLEKYHATEVRKMGILER